MRRLIVIAWIGVLVAVAPAYAEKRVALVVGNSAYSHASPLRNPSNDASDLAAALTRLDFDVTTVKDGTAAALADSLAGFVERLARADVALLWYAGHGIQFGGRNYLVPVDAQLANEFSFKRETFAFDEVIAAMEQRAKVSLVFIDACRNNPLADRLYRSIRAQGRDVGLSRGLARMEAKGNNTLIVFATAPGDTADDGSGRNSPFAEAMLRHIETPGVDVEVLLKDVTSEVRRNTGDRQRPERLSRLESKFNFKSAVETKPAPPVAAAPLASAPRAAGTIEREDDRIYWTSVKDSNDPVQLQSYIDRFPNGMFVDLARARLKSPARPAPAVAAAPPQPAPAPPKPPPALAAITPAAPVAPSPPRPPPAAAVPDVTARIAAYIEREFLNDREQFTEQVDYYNMGVIGRDRALKDRMAYALKWPERRYTMVPGSLQISPGSADVHTATFSYSYAVANGAKKASGKGRTQIKLKWEAGQFLITSVKEVVQSRAAGP